MGLTSLTTRQDSPRQPETVGALTYVNEKGPEIDGTIEPDYVILVNKAIPDGMSCGVHADYFEKYLRLYTLLPSAGEEIMMVRVMKRHDLK